MIGLKQDMRVYASVAKVQFKADPYIKALADAEWAAMDDEGKLPEGFTFPARVEFELGAG